MGMEFKRRTIIFLEEKKERETNVALASNNNER